MPCTAETTCYARIPISLINVAALALAVSSGYFANEGVSQGFVGFIEKHECCLHGKNETGHCNENAYIYPMHVTMWMFFVMCAMIAIVPWARFPAFLLWSRDLTILMMTIGGIYCATVWAAFNITFWRTVVYKCDVPFEGHMYQKMFDYNPFFTIVMSVLMIPVWIAAALAVLAGFLYMLTKYITLGWCKVKVEHAVTPATPKFDVPPEYASTYC